MREIYTQVAAIIAASPEKVYEILADYRTGHPAVLPEAYFKDHRVLEGGRGAGTVVEIQMDVWGFVTTLTLHVSEPEPGRILREEDPSAGVVTTFTVDPVQDGRQCRVTIVTRARASTGLRGLLETWFNPAITRRIYRQELKLLADLAQAQPD